MDSAFSVSVLATNDPLSFASSVRQQFLDFLGFVTCSVRESASLNLPGAASAQSTVGPIIVTATSSPVNTTSSTSVILSTGGSNPNLDPKSAFTKRDKAAIGVSVPIAVITIIVIAVFAVSRRRRLAQKKIIEDGDSPSTDEQSQPYLQQKAELEAKENSNMELEARERRHELDGGIALHEIPDQCSRYEIPNEDLWRLLPSLQVRQELRGEEHSLELQ